MFNIILNNNRTVMLLIQLQTLSYFENFEPNSNANKLNVETKIISELKEPINHMESIHFITACSYQQITDRLNTRDELIYRDL